MSNTEYNEKNITTVTEAEPSAEKIPITRPVFGSEEQLAIDEVLKSGWVVQGPKVSQFEKSVAEFIRCRHAIAVTSCTAALHLSLLAAGIGPGDEVLLPSFTFIATANAVEYTGARPVFIDIDLKTFNIDPDKIREYLEKLPRNNPTWPKALLPVSLFGLSADMAAINELAREFGLVVIEDAACAMGAVRDGHPAGTEGLTGNFSFHPRKAITTGEGGMVTTDDDTLAAEIKQLRDHGAAKTDLERHLRQGGSLLPEYYHLGYNYRMTDIQGAIGTAQMNRVEEILRGRHETAERYNHLLADIPELTIPFVPNRYHHAYQSYVCLYETERDWFENAEEISTGIIREKNRKRNRLMAALEENGIAVRQGTHAVHTLAYYRQKYGLDDLDFPRSFIADRLSITLPLYYGITEKEQARVVTTIKKVLSN